MRIAAVLLRAPAISLWMVSKSSLTLASISSKETVILFMSIAADQNCLYNSRYLSVRSPHVPEFRAFQTHRTSSPGSCQNHLLLPEVRKNVLSVQMPCPERPLSAAGSARSQPGSERFSAGSTRPLLLIRCTMRSHRSYGSSCPRKSDEHTAECCPFAAILDAECLCKAVTKVMAGSGLQCFSVMHLGTRLMS